MSNSRFFASGKAIFRQLVRYLLTGGLAFIVDFGIYAFCEYSLEWHYLLANLAGLVAGLVLNYNLSVKWVFADCKRSLESRKAAEFAVFTLVGIVGIGINELSMFFLIAELQVPDLISKIIAAAIVLVWNFCGRKLTLFRERKE